MKKQPTFRYFISINGKESVDMDSLQEENRTEIRKQLYGTFITNLGYERAEKEPQ